MTVLGGRLKQAREWKQLSQTEVFKRIKINNKTLSRYEKGGSEPDVETLNLLAGLYDVSVDWLTGRTDDHLIKQKTNETSIRPEDKKILEELHTLNPKDLEYVYDLIRRFKKE